MDGAFYIQRGNLHYICKKTYKARELANAAEARVEAVQKQADEAEARANRYEKMLRELGKL